MSRSPFEDQLVSYIEDAHAMEKLMDTALAAMIDSAPDMPEFQEPLTHHREETQEHIKRLEGRLEAYGESPAKTKDAAMMFGALGLGALNKIRTDTAGKVARDGFAAEHLEIAAYELLERVAVRAGDDETAEVARLNRADEEAMAKTLGESWDLALDVSFKQEGLEAAPPIPSPDSPVGKAT